MTTNTRIAGVDSGASANVEIIRNFAVHAALPNYNVTTPTGTKTSITLNFANSSGSVSSTNKINAILGSRSHINQYDGFIASRTNEVTAGTPFTSFQGELVFTSSNPYSSPYVRQEDLDLFGERYAINNSTTNEYKGQGNASARYISTQITLAGDQLAEDFKIYLTAYKPLNSDIVVYGKFMSPEDIESFDIKDWTELTLDQSTNLTTNPANLSDRVELSYSVPFYQSGTKLSGVFTTTSACNEILGTSGSIHSDRSSSCSSWYHGLC